MGNTVCLWPDVHSWSLHDHGRWDLHLPAGGQPRRHLQRPHHWGGRDQRDGLDLWRRQLHGGP